MVWLEEVSKKLEVPRSDFAHWLDTRIVPYRTRRVNCSDLATYISSFSGHIFEDAPKKVARVCEQEVVNRWQQLQRDNRSLLRELKRKNQKDIRISSDLHLRVRGIYPSHAPVTPFGVITRRSETTLVDCRNVSQEVRDFPFWKSGRKEIWGLGLRVIEEVKRRVTGREPDCWVLVFDRKLEPQGRPRELGVPMVLICSPESSEGTADNDILYWSKKITGKKRLISFDKELQKRFNKLVPSRWRYR